MKQLAVFSKHRGEMKGENLPYQAVFFSFDIQAKVYKFFFYGVQRKVDSSGYQGIIESTQEFLTYYKEQRNYVFVYLCTISPLPHLCTCPSHQIKKYDSMHCDNKFILWVRMVWGLYLLAQYWALNNISFLNQSSLWNRVPLSNMRISHLIWECH